MSSSKPSDQNFQGEINKLKAMLFGKGPDAYKLVRFINIKLKQFHLDFRYQASDVISRAYFIAEKKLKKGEKVDSLLSWLRTISFNVIRDLSKKQRRLDRKAERLIEKGFGAIFKTSDLYHEGINDEQKASLDRAMGTLSAIDQDILQLRIDENRSWENIASLLNITTDTARKRGSRALSRLRKAFFSASKDLDNGGAS